MERMMVLKIVVAGDGGVGKTSLIRRYCEGKFEHTRVETIGVDFQPQTLTDLTRWREEVLSAVPEQTFLVIGNKIDLERVVPTEQGRAFAESINAPYVETSALTGDGVPALFEALAKLALGR
jgi:GTPase SAR1 family protein